MRYLTFSPQENASYKICILVNDIRKDEIKRAYIEPYGLDPNEIIVISLHQTPGKKKTPAAEQKAYIIEELTPTLNDLGVELLLVADGEYFKTFTRSAKVDAVVGYMLDTEYGPWKVTYVPNYRTLFYDPVAVTQRIAAGVNALKCWMDGTYLDPGCDIIKFAAYPETIGEIRDWLEQLLEMDCDLTIDIEGFSLKHYDAGLGTITFCWSKSEGIAFPIDILDDEEHSRQVRVLLRTFFEMFQRRAIYHYISYDVYVLIYQLFMDNLQDNEGLLHGLDVMLRNWEDTKLITYLATNSCAGNDLSLKIQAQEYAGNYAVEEIKDIRKIPLPQLLQYNLVDGLSTWFTYEKHWDTMVRDQQLEIYQTIFKPAIKDIIQMQLTGMPLDIEQVRLVNSALEGISEDALQRMNSLPIIEKFNYMRLESYTNQKNSEWVKKRMTIQEMADAAKENENIRKEITFNPNSGPQLQTLLYDVLQLPVIDRTDTKQPATGGKTLKKLVNHTQDPDVKALLEALMDYTAVGTILSNFMPTFLNAIQGPDGHHWIFGFFNLGGTVSGRLSSSGPNLQNIPANVEMVISEWLMSKFGHILAPFVKDGKLSLGKLIKSCFVAPNGWFFCGIDFASLEDRISALTTKDPNKLKVYTDGYDGHSLRAVSYFGDQMPDIDPNSVQSINQLAIKGHKYGHLRQDSKTPTFLLTYGGTYIGIMEQLGWTKEKAQSVETRYHELYKVSDDWVKARLQQATQTGYVTVAFGLRVRTPLLRQVVLGNSKTPFAAEAEGRTAGNAMGQSWCLLNSRAGSEFMAKVRTSEFRHDIKPCAQIHDANYVLVRDNIDALLFANTHLVMACEWQNHSDIWHPDVKLGGEFSIFYPDWSKEAVLPNHAKAEDVFTVFSKHIEKLAA